MKTAPVAIIGAGLAGSEAARLLLEVGVPVDLYEMKPQRYSEAHSLPGFAELVCSNSLKSTSELHPSGMLKSELAGLGSIIMEAAAACRVPAGESLSVDRTLLSEYVTRRLTEYPALTIKTDEVREIPSGYTYCIVATGPLTSPALAEYLGRLIGGDFLYFYDAVAPIIDADSIDGSRVFAGSRYGKGGDDYLNIPLTREEYAAFVGALRTGEKVVLRPFEKEMYYEGCLPIEVLAGRGDETLAFGPMKPVGFSAEQAGFKPHAVIQLRREDAAGTAYNIVGFQTKLTYTAQERIFRQLPGLAKAQFLRHGSIHRNTYVDAPSVLTGTLGLVVNEQVILAGQITGVEGYLESAATGVLAGLFTLCRIMGREPLRPPATTALGALLSHLADGRASFQPSGIHLGLFEKKELPRKADKKEFVRRQELAAFADWRKDLAALLGDDAGQFGKSLQ